MRPARSAEAKPETTADSNSLHSNRMRTRTKQQQPILCRHPCTTSGKGTIGHAVRRLCPCVWEQRQAGQKSPDQTSRHGQSIRQAPLVPLLGQRQAVRLSLHLLARRLEQRHGQELGQGALVSTAKTLVAPPCSSLQGKARPNPVHKSKTRLCLARCADQKSLRSLVVKPTALLCRRSRSVKKEKLTLQEW